jgi:glycosyltransferase involved in cell wall biosynthesis
MRFLILVFWFRTQNPRHVTRVGDKRSTGLRTASHGRKRRDLPALVRTMNEQSLPTVSVIIPTKNRAADLEVVIEDLLQQSRLPMELIVVDQSIQRSYGKPIPIALRYIHHPELSGAATARNAGMDVANGDILLFLDDDVILEKSFIEQIVAAFRPGVTGVSGIITNYKRPALARRLWEGMFVRTPFLDERQQIYWKAEKLLDEGPIRIRKMTGALMSFRAEAVRTLRFDSNLTGGSPGEDIDLCASLPEGSILVMTPRARLVHKRSPAGREQVYWLALHAQVSSYLRERHWKHGFRNNAAYAWLNTGYAGAALLSCMRRRSFDPWKRWREGAKKGFALAHPNE